MKDRVTYFLVVFLIFVITFFGYGLVNYGLSTPLNEMDSTQLINYYQQLKKDKKMLPLLDIEDESEINWRDDQLKLIFGDLNNDGKDDAMLLSFYEDKSNDKYWNAKYLVFLCVKNNQWVLIDQLFSGFSSFNSQLVVQSISNGKVYSQTIDNKDNKVLYATTHIVKNKYLYKWNESLHAPENDFENRLSVNQLVVADSTTIGSYASLKKLKTKVKTGSIVNTVELSDCSTLYNPSISKTWINPGVLFESEDKKYWDLVTVVFNNSDERIHTSIGTITSSTSLNELNHIMKNWSDWKLDKNLSNENTIIYTIRRDLSPDSPFWQFEFTPSGRLLIVSLLRTCES